MIRGPGLAPRVIGDVSWRRRCPAFRRGARWLAYRPGAAAWLALAAILGKKAEQRIHGVVTRGINHRTAFAPHGDQVRLLQAVEMEGERIGRDPKGISYFS